MNRPAQTTRQPLGSLVLGQASETQKAALQPNGAALSHDQIEKELLKIYARHFPEKEIQPTENFFEIGGDSLQLINITYDVESCFSILVPLEVFLNGPTIRELAAYLDAAETTARGL
jgi:acyl carrier protein